MSRWRNRSNDDLDALLSTTLASLQPGDAHSTSVILELMKFVALSPSELFSSHPENFQATKCVAALRTLIGRPDQESTARGTTTNIGHQADGSIVLVSIDLRDGDAVIVPLLPAEARALAMELWSYSKEGRIIQQ